MPPPAKPLPAPPCPGAAGACLCSWDTQGDRTHGVGTLELWDSRAGSGYVWDGKMTSASGCASVTTATSLLTLTASAGAGAGVMYTAVGVSPDMALSICEARSSKGREAGARRGAGAGAWRTPAPHRPGSRVCPQGSPVYSSPAAQRLPRSVRGSAGRRWMGSRSPVLARVAATDLWSASVRAFIWEMGFNHVVGARVWRMRAGKVSPAAGCAACVRGPLAVREMGGRQ